MESENALAITALRHPFGTERADFVLPAGQTIGEVLRTLNVYPPRGCDARVFIGDALILRAYWELVTPKAGQLMTVRVIPAGGRGVKSVLAIVLTIAFVALGAFVGAAVGGALLGGGLGAGLGSALGGLAGSFVASQLASAIAPPPKPKALSGVGIENSPTLQGVGNTINRYGPVPKIFGKDRIYPPVNAVPLEAQCKRV